MLNFLHQVSYRSKLIMDFDDSNSGFDLISSQPEIDYYSEVPEDKVYKFKFLSASAEDDSHKHKCRYNLKKGVALPYTTNSGGKNIFEIIFLHVS